MKMLNRNCNDINVGCRNIIVFANENQNIRYPLQLKIFLSLCPAYSSIRLPIKLKTLSLGFWTIFIALSALNLVFSDHSNSKLGSPSLMAYALSSVRSHSETMKFLRFGMRLTSVMTP